jgi:hypothetical protein
MDLETEWRNIENLIEVGIIPSDERILCFLAAASERKDRRFGTGEILFCIGDIFMLEEEDCVPADPVLKDILTFLESMAPNGTD